VVRVRTGIAIGAVRDVLAPVELVAVHAVTTVLALTKINAIFHKVAPRAQVGVLAEGEEVIKFAVFIVQLESSGLGDFLEEFPELIEEWAREIHLLAKISRVPVVRPPARSAVNREGAPCGEGGDGRFPAEVAGVPVELHFIAECETALQPALRAERGWGNPFFLPVKHR
jgi:enamine deaminase RidA (YjgF/YER057c/UK114 family)